MVVAVVTDKEIVAISKSRTCVLRIVNGLFRGNELHLLHHVQGKEEPSFRWVILIATILHIIPFQRCVACNYLAELGLDESERMGGLATYFVEFWGSEEIVGGTEQKNQLLWHCFLLVLQ